MNKGKIVIFYISMTAFLFATMEVALKVAGSQLDSFQLTFWRFLVGGLFLAPFAVPERRKSAAPLRPADMGYLLLLGILCIPLSMLFFQLGIMRSNAATASVLISISPLFTVLFAYLIAKEPLTRRKLLSLLLGSAGILFMIRPWDIQPGNTPAGVGFMLLAAFFFGLYTVAGKFGIGRIGIFTQTTLSFLMGSAVLLVIILFMGKPVFSGIPDQIPLVLYVGIMVTGVGYFCYFKAVARSGASTASYAFFIKPAIAPIFAVLILHEILLWNTYVGVGLILAASFLNLSGAKGGNHAQK